MSKGHIVVDGAICKCKFGFTPDMLTVQSQTKAYINDGAASKKLVANTMDLGMPLKAKTFGQCKLQPTSSGYLPCIPAITQWQDPYENVILSNNGKILTEKSKATCAIAGSPCVEFTFHGQIPTGAPPPPSADEQEVLSQLDPLASEMVLEEVVGEIPAEPFTNDIEDTDEALKFKAYFLRTPTYQGEFGFDWMRQEYLSATQEGQGISEDPDKLKKEYTPAGETSVWVHEGAEYYVPWVSMFPKQEGVELLLSGYTYNDFIEVKDEDIVKLPEKNGVYFKDETGKKLTQVKLSAIKDDMIQVTLCCDQPVNKDFVLELKDKDDTVVGKLNFFANANHEQLKFEITPVRVLRGISQETDKQRIEDKIDKGFGDANKGLAGDLQNLENYLNTNSLNQALLKCNIGKVYDIVVDEKEWIDDDLIVQNGGVFKDVNILDKFNKEFEKQHPFQANKKDLVVFLSPISKKGAGGEGDLFDIDARSLAIYQSNLAKQDSFAHEITHVLGLPHTFKEKEFTREEITKSNEYVKQVDDYFNYLMSNNTPKNEIAEKWKEYKDSYAGHRGILQVYYNYLDKGRFYKKGATDNFMDYCDERKSYYHWQWKILQHETKSYH